MRSRTLLFCFHLVGCALLSSCGPKRVELLQPIPPIPVQWQDEAARGGLAVLTVAEWDDYVADLQPTFALTAEQALQRAIPVTLREIGTVQDALTFGVKLAPPTSTSSSSSTDVSGETGNTAANTGETSNTTTTGGVSTTGSTATSSGTTGSTTNTTSQTTSTSTSGAGDLSKVPAGALPGLPAVTLPAANPLAGAIEINPMTLYTAATALYQEVKLLNRYVRDAALRQGYKPYVLRLQVSVLPQLRGQAYDAYTMLSFLKGGTEQALLNPYSVPDDIRTASTATTDLQGVHVIPLLVTDAMEQSSAATSLSRLRGLSVAAAAMQQGFGASAEIARQIQTLQSVLGEDTNSLMTVSKVSDSSLRVRFGAVRQVGSGLGLEARNHTVTLLLLLPSDTETGSEADDITVVSKLSLVRATDGFRVPERPLDVVKRDVHDAVCRYTTECGSRLDRIPATVAATIDRLAYAVQRNDHRSLATDLDTLKIPKDAAQRVWVDVLDIVSRGSFSEVSFELPNPSPAATLPASGTDVLSAVDDGTATVLRVSGVRGARAADLVATLRVTKGSETVSFIATQIDDSTNVLRMVFPSLSKLSFCSKTEVCSKLDVVLVHTKPRDRWSTAGSPGMTSTTLDKIKLLQPEGPAPRPTAAFVLASGTRLITRTPTGEANLTLTVQLDDTRLDETVFFNVDGASVTAATGSGVQVKLTPKGWQVTGLQKGVVASLTLSLAGLGDDIDVRITPTNGQATREALIFRVRTQVVQ